jgi:hypothetical protein
MSYELPSARTVPLTFLVLICRVFDWYWPCSEPAPVWSSVVLGAAKREKGPSGSYFHSGGGFGRLSCRSAELSFVHGFSISLNVIKPIIFRFIREQVRSDLLVFRPGPTILDQG